MVKKRLRFAPSPTGLLHAGNARIAILNFLFTQQNDAELLLRIDDTDAERSQKIFEHSITEDLTWLGLEWKETLRQSERLELYDKSAKRLLSSGRLYPCFETSDELAFARHLQLQNKRPPIYNRASLDAQKLKTYEREGRKPHFRFKLEHRVLLLQDMCSGGKQFNFTNISDPVLIRENGNPLYTFSSVVDDGECGITHIVRGEDHLTNSALQVQLFEALGYAIPQFAHLPLMRSENNQEPLSKRCSSLSLRKLRETHSIEAKALLIYLARLGTARMDYGGYSYEDLAKEFSFDDFGRAASAFDFKQLIEVNRRVLTTMNWRDFEGRLSDLPSLRNEDKAKFWDVFRANINCFQDLLQWAEHCFSDSIKREKPPKEMRAILCDMFTSVEFATNKKSWEQKYCEKLLKALVRRLSKQLNLQGAKLYRPLRVALLGCEEGPELWRLFMLLGKKRVVQRLCEKTC